MIEITAVFILLFISGTFSGTEVAYTSLSFEQLETMKHRKGKKGELTARLHDRLDNVLTTITIGNNIANLAASALISAWTIRLFGEAWLTVSTAVLTILVLIIGEVTPKQIGIIHNERVALSLARVLHVLSYVFLPFILVIAGISNFLTRLTGGAPRPKVTTEGLRHMARYAGRTGVLNQFHASIVKNAIRSHEVRIEAIMTHRTKIVSVGKHETAATVLERMIESGYSRLPVYDDDDDPEYIVGIIILRDVVRIASEDPNLPVSRGMTPPIFVPENRTIDEMLARLQREHVNMAIVLDEYGGVAGLVTIEDLVEEFVGELYDENETAKKQAILKKGDGYVIAGDTPLHVVNDHLDLELPIEGDAQTIGGYLTEELGDIPPKGATYKISSGSFTVADVSSSRIVTVHYRRDPIE